MRQLSIVGYCYNKCCWRIDFPSIQAVANSSGYLHNRLVYDAQLLSDGNVILCEKYEDGYDANIAYIAYFLLKCALHDIVIKTNISWYSNIIYVLYQYDSICAVSPIIRKIMRSVCQYDLLSILTLFYGDHTLDISVITKQALVLAAIDAYPSYDMFFVSTTSDLYKTTVEKLPHYFIKLLVKRYLNTQTTPTMDGVFRLIYDWASNHKAQTVDIVDLLTYAVNNKDCRISKECKMTILDPLCVFYSVKKLSLSDKACVMTDFVVENTIPALCESKCIHYTHNGQIVSFYWTVDKPKNAITLSCDRGSMTYDEYNQKILLRVTRIENDEHPEGIEETLLYNNATGIYSCTFTCPVENTSFSKFSIINK